MDDLLWWVYKPSRVGVQFLFETCCNAMQILNGPRAVEHLSRAVGATGPGSDESFAAFKAPCVLAGVCGNSVQLHLLLTCRAAALVRRASPRAYHEALCEAYLAAMASNLPSAPDCMACLVSHGVDPLLKDSHCGGNAYAEGLMWSDFEGHAHVKSALVTLTQRHYNLRWVIERELGGMQTGQHR